jgi:hypothetical protein
MIFCSTNNFMLKCELLYFLSDASNPVWIVPVVFEISTFKGVHLLLWKTVHKIREPCHNCGCHSCHDKCTKGQKAHSKFKTPPRNSKLDFEIQNSISKFKIPLRNSKLVFEFKTRLRNSKLDFEIQNSTSKFKTPLRNSKLDFEIQNSTSKFETWLRNSKFDFEIQNSASKFKNPLRISKLGWPMKNSLMKWENDFRIQGRYIFRAVWEVTEITDHIRPFKSLQAYFYL